MTDISDFHVHIVGLGLMGGSLAMVWRNRIRRITATDTCIDVLSAAKANGLVDGCGPLEVSQADVIVLAVPADRMKTILDTMSLKPGQLVIDIGSTKTDICNIFDQLPTGIESVGGHPMCGVAENGFENAFATMYEGAQFILCETTGTTDRTRQVAEQLVHASGAIPLWMDRQQHDYLTALTSHVPHLLSFALMRLAEDVSQEENELYNLAAGGFDGATRLARTSETMIRGMLTTNSGNIKYLMQRLRQQLDFLESLMDDPESLVKELALIVEARRNYSQQYGERLIT